MRSTELSKENIQSGGSHLLRIGDQLLLQLLALAFDFRYFRCVEGTSTHSTQKNKNCVIGAPD